MYVYYVHERGKAARLVSIESSFGKRGALACDVVAHFTGVKCECGIISTRHVCVQIVWQNECREGACSFRATRFTTFGGSKPPPYGQTRCGAAASNALLLHLWYH